jgi:SpoVK/Ycf46/Vps4 family AAA+-type ATPase
VVTDGGDGKLNFKIIENKPSDKIILNEDTEMVIDEFVLASLSETGKRTYLLTGGYGNGKTESVMRIGRVAVEEHKMSFFYVKDSSLFEAMLNLSKNYQPAIIFLEDIDEIASGSNRDSRMNSILNILDGVETKGNNLTVVFTTNHPEKINKALRRPGRIDLMIKFENPTYDTTGKILKAYFIGMSGEESLDYDKCVKAISDIKTINAGDKTDKTVGVPGAVIAEICKRAVKLAAKKGGEISDRVVISSVSSIKYQVELMAGDVEETPKEKKLWDMVFGQISEAVTASVYQPAFEACNKALGN